MRVNELMTYKCFKNYEQEKLIVFEFVNNSNVFYNSILEKARISNKPRNAY